MLGFHSQRSGIVERSAHETRIAALGVAGTASGPSRVTWQGWRYAGRCERVAESLGQNTAFH